MIISDAIIKWLLDGDTAVSYQVHRDLLGAPETVLNKLQKHISAGGWGAKFLSKQKSNGHWGITFYQPKWTSTHYTLLDLKTIGLDSGNHQAQKAVNMLLAQPPGKSGGINLSVTLKESDVCVNGMILNYAAYFLPHHKRISDIVEYLLRVQMKDGGWNCQYQYPRTTHSSFHSTLSVLEGLLQYRSSPGARMVNVIKKAEKRAIEFLLKHHLYQSHRTGKIIDRRFLRLSFPTRWRYDILRCLDYMQQAKLSYDPRMQLALDILYNKQDKNGKWPLQEVHKGAVHFQMEKVNTPSRWNTLRALRVFKHFNENATRPHVVMPHNIRGERPNRKR